METHWTVFKFGIVVGSLLNRIKNYCSSLVKFEGWLILLLSHFVWQQLIYSVTTCIVNIHRLWHIGCNGWDIYQVCMLKKFLVWLSTCLWKVILSFEPQKWNGLDQLNLYLFIEECNFEWNVIPHSFSCFYFCNWK